MEEGVTQPKEDIPGEIMTPSAAAKAVPSAKNLLLMVTRLVIDPPTVRDERGQKRPLLDPPTVRLKGGQKRPLF